MKRLFGTDGIRGIVGEGLTAALAHAVGRALGPVLSLGGGAPPHVLIGWDTRRSSEMLAAALSSGLSSVGSDVTLLGVLPTPAVAALILERQADAGVVISASHNPSEYNGIKIFGADGYKLPDALEEEIERLVAAGESATPAAPPTALGRIGLARHADREYTDALLSTMDTDLSALTVAVDCANGAASRTAPRLFRRLGLSLHLLSASPDGENINKGCGSTCLAPLGSFVREHRCDVGIAFDGDADRCLLVNAEGAPVDGDEILGMCALDRRARGLAGSGAVVGTVMSNLGLSRLLSAYGIGFHTAPVGDRYVLERMRAEGCTLGGEQSGHIIFAENAKTGDGQRTALEVLSLMVRTGKPLSALAAVMTRYPQATENLALTPAARLAFYTDPAILEVQRSAESALGERGRLLLRPSGTEPLLRLTVEAEDGTLLERTLTMVKENVSRILEKY